MPTFAGEKRVAVDDGRVVGFVHWVPSPRCQLSSVRKFGIAAAMIRGFGVRSTIRVAGWLSVWSKHDPREPHIHLGPIGVVPEARGRGVGRRLMEPFCAALDASGAIGYLETDRAENVDFCSRFGFEVTGRAPIHGVVTYFMTRRAQVKSENESVPAT
jgi:GNAT superfamily N-acetyltransferase